MRIKCVTACGDAGGGPAFHACVVDCTAEQYEDGDHYDAARAAAGDARHERTERAVVFDEDDGPAWLFKHFDWAAAPVVRCGEDDDDG